MKINVTYEGKDIEALVRKDLDAKGLSGEAVILFDGGQVQVTIEGEFDERPAAALAPRPSKAREGGGGIQEDADMSEVLGQSSSAARRPGMYPAPERSYMEGESDESPTR